MAQRQFRSDDTSSWSHKFGNGSDGALTISSNTTFSAANEGCSGTSGTTSLTLAAAGGFANGDLVLIHQSRGTGVGNWELNKIASGGGTTSLTMSYDLTNTYTDSGASQAQIVKLFQYSSVTVNSGITWSAPAWNGSKGGILAFLCNGLTDVNGSISSSSNGFDGAPATGTGTYVGKQGEGDVGVGGAISTSNNGSGGGGGGDDGPDYGGGGGGGGHANSGTTPGSGAATGGSGGSTSGSSSLVTMTFGGSGGSGGSKGTNGVGGVGGNSGGIVLIISKQIEVDSSTGSILSSGQNGGAGSALPSGSGGGGGSGGSVLMKSETATLGTNRVTSSAGAAGAAGGNGTSGGAGSVGRIHLDYTTSYTGTTSPTLDVTQDTSLLSANSGIFFTF